MGDRFSGQVGRVIDLAREEAERLGHRYVGPEHLLLGLLREGRSQAARILQAHGVDLAAARAALDRLANQGLVPGPRPSDAELLGTLGIDLEQIRRSAEQAFGVQAVKHAIGEAVRARRGGVGRVPRTPMQGPAMLTTQATWLASRQARALGHGVVNPELLLLGVLEDIRTPWPRCMSNPWVRQLLASSACPRATGAWPDHLLTALGVDLDDLRYAVAAELREPVS